MKKPAPIQISIPEPCTQDWNAMQPVGGGRHCAQCQKAVVDFTRMTDAQLLDYLQKSGRADCGRFTAEQLNRTIQAVEVPRSMWWARVAAGLLLTSGLTKTVNAQSKGNKQPTKQSASANKRQVKMTQTDYPLGIIGTLKNQKGTPIVNAWVEVSQGGIIKGCDLTDFDGNYQIRPLDSGVYGVKFRHLDKDTIYNAVFVKDGQVNRVDGVISTSSNSTEPIPIIRMGVPLINLDKQKRRK